MTVGPPPPSAAPARAEMGSKWDQALGPRGQGSNVNPAPPRLPGGSEHMTPEQTHSHLLMRPITMASQQHGEDSRRARKDASSSPGKQQAFNTQSI